MYLARIRIESRDPLAEATRSEDVVMEVLEYIVLDDDDILFLVRVNGDAPKCLKVVEGHPDTRFVQILEKTPTSIDFLVVLRGIVAIRVFEDSYCFVKPPISVENGFKYYTLLVPEISFLTEAYSKLGSIGSWKVLEVKRLAGKRPMLTDAQNRVLKVAWEMEYFSRSDVTLRDVAAALGLSKSTVHRHLKDSIRKLVEGYMEEKRAEKLIEIEVR